MCCSFWMEGASPWARAAWNRTGQASTSCAAPAARPADSSLPTRADGRLRVRASCCRRCRPPDRWSRRARGTSGVRRSLRRRSRRSRWFRPRNGRRATISRNSSCPCPRKRHEFEALAIRCDRDRRRDGELRTSWRSFLLDMCTRGSAWRISHHYRYFIRSLNAHAVAVRRTQFPTRVLESARAVVQHGTSCWRRSS